METRTPSPVVVCTACRAEFHPDLKSNGPWRCEKCGTSHGNLRLHWRIIALLLGVAPILIVGIGMLLAVALPIRQLRAPLGLPDGLELAAFTVPAVLGLGARLLAVFFALNTIPLLIVISAFVIPRPWNDRGLKIQVFVWLALLLAAATGSVAEGLGLGLWSLAVVLPIPVYLVWLLKKTGQRSLKIQVVVWFALILTAQIVSGTQGLWLVLWGMGGFLLVLITLVRLSKKTGEPGLKTLVFVWLILTLAVEIVSVAMGRSLGLGGLILLLPVLAHFMWLSRQTAAMVRSRAVAGALGGLRPSARRPAAAGRRAADGRAAGLRRRGGPRAAVQRKIDALRSRVRELVALHALSWIVGTVIAAVLLLGLVDYVARFQDRGIRVILSLVVLGAFGWTCYRFLYLGLTAGLRDVDLARRLQRCFPALGDGLASAVEFLDQSEDDPTAGSVALRRAVIAQTTAETEPLDFRAAIEPAPTLRAVLSAAVICLMALSLAVLDPLASQIALARLGNPFRDVAWPQNTHLAVLEREPPADRIAPGRTFRIEVIDTRGVRLPSKVRIRYRFQGPDGTTTEETQRLQSVDGARIARSPNVTRPFSYRIEIGDESTPWIPVGVPERAATGPASSGPARPAAPSIPVARLLAPSAEAADSPVAHLAVVRREWRRERVASGQAFEVEVTDARGALLPPAVRIHYRFQDDGTTTEETELMHQYLGGSVVARREDIQRPFSYRVEGGDDDSMPWIPVEVREPPDIESMAIELIPPAYTGWPTEKSEMQIHALVGTRVRIAATATRPLRRAFLCLEGGRRVEARLTGEARRNLAVEFAIERSGAYWFKFTDAEGLTSHGDVRWEIRAVPDDPPSVSIERPAANVFVTPQAVVPLRVSAKENLAIRRIDLEFSRSDRPEEADVVFPLHVGPDRPSPQPGGLSGGAELGESRVIAYNWQLADLELPTGTQVTFRATATDYQPRTGKSEPRSLLIITPEELADRIAARQNSLVAELSRVLEMQRQSRGQVRVLEIQSSEVGRLTQLDVDHLRGAELNQRQVNRTLTSRSEGVPMHILGLLADLENNKVDSPDLRRRMQALLDEIARLQRDHLPPITRELTTAIKAAQVRLETPPPPGDNREDQPPPQDKTIAASLVTAGEHQDRVIDSLEQMLDQLGRWDNYRRFHRELGRLLREQEELAGDTTELGRRTLTRELKDLAPQESADLKILAQRQLELARWLDRIQQGMGQAVEQLRDPDPLAAETVSDALHRAGELAIGGQMRSTGGNLQRNQMGQAIGRQEQIIRDLQEVLDILANRRESELARLIKKLRQAETDLVDLAEREEGLRKRIEEAADRPPAEQQQQRRELERLSREQEQLQQEAERMARRLERLMADRAGQSTRQAAAKMAGAAQSAAKGAGREASKQAEGAKKDLEKAAGELARQRRQAEAELALEQLARLEDTLKAAHGRQEKVLEETLRLDELARSQGQLTRPQAAGLHELAREQSALKTEVTTLGERLVGAEVFRLALTGVAGDMARAAGLLGRRQTGPPTQQAEQDALARLEQLLEALKPEQPDEQANNSGQGSGGPAGQPGGQGGGVQTLAELKLLKLMQQEVNRRTRALEEAFGPADELTDEARRQYAELSGEQGRLADLLLNLIQPEPDPENNPEGLPDARPPDDVPQDPLAPVNEEEFP